jgi:uncharacterized protein (TIGR02453 family)
MAQEPHFSPALFAFLSELRANNNRPWFQANKERYERDVREPMLHFIADFGVEARKLSPYIVADPRRAGGSMFRIHRDTRFAKDKSPYKSSAAARFTHADGKDVHAPGFFLHMEPDRVIAGAGVWRPDSTTLGRIRDALVAEPEAWRRAISGKAFKTHGRLGGEALKRPPRGYDPEHPLIEDLKRKDFITVSEFGEAEACAADFLSRFTRICRAAAPLQKFLTAALGVPW